LTLLSEIIFISHEVGDKYSFCNPEEGMSLNSSFIQEDKGIRITLKTGEILVHPSLEFDNGNASCLFNTVVSGSIDMAMDFVIRVRLPSSYVKNIEIKDYIFTHKNSNKYMYPSLNNRDFIILNLNDGRVLKISFNNLIQVDKNWSFRPYIRDEVENWILHFRFLPKNGQLGTKNCVSWYRSQPIPSFLQGIFDCSGYSENILYKSEISPRGPILRRLLNLTSYYFARLDIAGQFKLRIDCV
jgi:hypothetical protein